jgi:hypothetical protein
MSGIGTKGGSGLMFHEEAGKQKAILNSGSNRGSISLTSDSPSNALIQSDTSNLLNFISRAFTASSSIFLSGVEHSITAESNTILKIFNMLQLAMTAAQQAQSISDEYKDPESHQEVQPSDMATKSLGLVDMSLGGLFKGINDYTTLKSLFTGSPLLPHNNLISLKVNSTGSSGAWRSKIADAKTVANGIAVFGKIFPSISPIANAVVNTGDLLSFEEADKNIKEETEKKEKMENDKAVLEANLPTLQNDTDKAKNDYDNAVANKEDPETIAKLKQIYDEKLSEYNNQKDKISDLNAQISELELKIDSLIEFKSDKSTQISKVLSDSASMGTELNDVIYYLVSAFATFMTMVKPSGPTQGILIDNSDSYVSLNAKHFSTLSGYGPVIIESSVANISELLSSALFDATRPTKILKPESISSPNSADYETAKAIFLASEFVSALADEINFMADKSLIAKAADNVQIIAGVKPAQQPRAKAIATAKAQIALQANIMEAAAADETVAAANLLHEKIINYLNSGRVVSYDPNYTKGILLKTQAANSPVTLQTTDPSSSIALIQGSSSPADPLDKRAIELSDTETTIEDGSNTKLTLKKATDTSGEVNLQAASEAKLTMSLNNAKLSSCAAVNLSLTQDSAIIKAPTKIVLDVGASKLELTLNGIDCKVGPMSQNIAPAMLSEG